MVTSTSQRDSQDIVNTKNLRECIYPVPNSRPPQEIRSNAMF